MIAVRFSCLHRAFYKRRLWLGISLALTLLSLTLVQTRTALLDDADAYAIKDAQIVTGAGKTIAKGNIVIRNGLIVDLGENARIPADARIIEGAGLTVYPGLIDGYNNLGLPAPQQATPAPGAGCSQADIAAAA